MLILNRTSSDPKPSEITSESAYNSRRAFLKNASLGSIALGSGALSLPAWAAGAYESASVDRSTPAWLATKIAQRKVATSNPTGETITPYEAASTYNNFYEFGTGKSDPANYSDDLVTDPWKLQVGGLCENPGNYQLEDFVKPYRLEDRIYRFRCVEAWSMVVPWLGFGLADILKAAKPTSKARFVKFTTLERPSQMPGQRTAALDWPYIESLRLDEARHPLALMAVGMYGRSLPNQNGAPLRLIVPWKYGFKSIKSIVKIEFTNKAPITTWLGLAPREYGFYANVNPAVSHPRWSQARERRLPNSLFSPNWVDTKLFNGYSEVAPLYKTMDLKKFF